MRQVVDNIEHFLLGWELTREEAEAIKRLVDQRVIMRHLERACTVPRSSDPRAAQVLDAHEEMIASCMKRLAVLERRSNLEYLSKAGVP